MLDNKFCEGKDYLMRKTTVIMTACFVASSVLCACGNEMNKETSDAGNNAALESINNEIVEDFNTEQAATEDESTKEYVDIAILNKHAGCIKAAGKEQKTWKKTSTHSLLESTATRQTSSRKR